MKILITGGHLAPALSCVDELRDKKKTEIVFVGRKYNNEREKTLSLEFKEITDRHVRFVNLTAGRLTRHLSMGTLRSFLNIPLGFLNSYFILAKEKPDVILSFGGYLALPIALASKLWGATVYTHEQTIRPGLANRIISLAAKKIFLSFEESKKFFPKDKVVVTGNPIRRQVFEVIKKPFIFEEKLPVIYITGGSLGSHSINIHIKNILPQLLEHYIVIHQTGNVAEFDDYGKLEEYRRQLPQKLQKRYFLKQHINADEIGDIYQRATLVISRSGANTFFELAALKKPAVLIPLPWSAYGEQQKQAEIMKKIGVSEIFNQEHGCAELLALIEKMMNNIEHYQNKFTNLESAYPKNAAEIIISQITQDR